MKWTLLLQIFCFLTASFLEVKIAQARERYEFFNGVRQEGMGGASIGVVNDETSLLSNPANLGKLRDSYLTLIDPELTVSGKTTQKILDGANPLDLFKIQGLIDALKDKSDEHIHSKLQIFPSAVFQNFGIGIFKKYSIDGTSDATGANAAVDYFDDTALVMGFNFRFFDGRIKLGFAARYVDHIVVNEDAIPTSTTGSTVGTYAKEGVGLGADVGLTLTAPWYLLPSLSVVAHDVGGTSYTMGSGTFYSTAERPKSSPQTYDAAFSFFPILGNKVHSSFTFEMSDVLNVYEEDDAQRRYHVGAEINIYDAIFVRAGMNQRYWTAGLEYATEMFQFQFATYGEDIGNDGSAKEDRRYTAKFTVRF